MLLLVLMTLSMSAADSEVSGGIRRLNADGGTQFRVQDGQVVEDIVLAGNGFHVVHSLAAAADGSYLVASGYRSSSVFQGEANIDGNLDAFISLIPLDGGPGWTQLISSGREDVGMKAMVSEDVSSIFLVGYSQAESDADAYLRKYDRNGALVFTREIATSGNDYGQSIALDASGNVVITVSMDGSLFGLANQGKRDVRVLKYDPDGRLLWGQMLGSSGVEESRDLAIDGQGAIYVTGHTGRERPAGDPGLGGMGVFGNEDIFVTKFGPSGQKLWTYTAGTSGADLGNDIVVSSSGQIVLTGETSGGLNGTVSHDGISNVFLITLNAEGPVLPTYTVIEKAGAVSLQQQVENGHLYAVEASGGVRGITYQGQPIHPGIFPGWQALAVERVGGVNTVL
jgi:hypothetical protein